MLQINGLRGISTLSTKLKTVLAVLTVLQLSLDLANRGPDSSDVLGNILEYSLAFSIIGFALITAWDVRAFRFVYGKYY